ncbi:MAG: hypothetical protein L3K09_07950, partial [Thermoplasmata archaeon]|nr:hypothetical protein [Thermoplasmata archaeon]
MTDWISSTAIFVRSRKRAAKWYSQVFGWKNLADDDHWTVVGPAKRGGRLHLCERRKLGASHVGETGILIVCEQFDRTVARLEKAPAYIDAAQKLVTHPGKLYGVAGQQEIAGAPDFF